MKRSIGRATGLAIGLWAAVAAQAADRFVSLTGTNDTAGGYTNWAGASTNIQDAINVAVAPETIWVTNGYYMSTSNVVGVTRLANPSNYTMVCVNKAVKLRSMNGPAATILDANGSATTQRHCLIVNTAGAVVDGFTVRGGYITSARFPGYPHYLGGGILSYTRDALVTNCIITGNYADNAGAGLFPGGTIANCIISNNTGSSAIYWQGGVHIVRNCTITDNPAGGIVLNDNGNFENCRITRNGTLGITEAGGAKASNGGKFRNCLFMGNQGTYGGGVQLVNPNPMSITNCTIVSNKATYGGGLYLANQSGAGSNRFVQNTIIYGNLATIASSNVYVAGALDFPRISYSCTPDDMSAYGANNITNDPQFVDMTTGNYRLRANSPCINTGTNGSWPATDIDLDGRTRIRYETVDMGAYEFIRSGTIFGFH
ncbi:MAG: right-handed parallel beta-helix repeat-containing protein [Kiritimatiellae bacterium]|nr:right-handed parallel beta-helix repeat-containing protein [Kiritimatiellia bacterium]